MSGVAVQRPFEFRAKKKSRGSGDFGRDCVILRKCASGIVDYVYTSQWSE